MTRRKQAAQSAPPEGDNGGQAAEPVTVAADLTAAAELLGQDAARTREHAAQVRADAQSVVAEAERQAAEILAAAQAQAAVLAPGADADDQDAARLEETARRIASASAARDQAEAADQLAAALEAERAQIAAKITGLESTIDRLAADRQDAAAELAAADRASDAAARAASLGRDRAAEDLARARTADLQAAQARAAAIGDDDGPGELADALAAARSHRAAAWEVLTGLAEDGDAHPAVLEARDTEAERAAAAAVQETGRLDDLAAQLRVALEPVPAIHAELVARRTGLRSLASGVELRKQTALAERYVASAGRSMDGVAACTARLSAADPASLGDALTAARHCRAELRRLLGMVPPPPGEDDPGSSAEIAAYVAEAALAMVAEPSPAARRQSVVTHRG